MNVALEVQIIIVEDMVAPIICPCVREMQILAYLVPLRSEKLNKFPTDPS